MQSLEKEDDRLSLVSPVGYSVSTCGYCTPSGSGQRSKTKSSKSYGVWANNITAETYQQMIDRGWRRSGHYIYRPDCGYSGTCCPQIAIRILVDQYRPRSDQRRAISSLQRLVRQPSEAVAEGRFQTSTISASHKGKYSARWDLEQQWKLVEWSEPDQYEYSETSQPDGTDEVQIQKDTMRPIHKQRHQVALEERQSKISKLNSHTKLLPLMGPKRRRFETTLRLAQSTPEKYALFRSYQMKVHGESETKVSDQKGFERFLCKGPLMPFTPGRQRGETSKDGAVDIQSLSPMAYDQYHMEYRYEGNLVAIGVLDILPNCISSVYLFYDPGYSHLYLGKVSAIREMLLVKQIQRKQGMEGIRYYNLGLYVHSCRKMRYKAEYQPAEVLDPSTCEWILYDDVKAQLDQGIRYDFLKHCSDRPMPPVILANGSTDKNSMAMEVDKAEVDEDEDLSMPIPPPPGILDPTALPNEMIALSLIFDNGRVNLLMRSNIMAEPNRLQQALECIAALGPLYNRICMYF